MKLATKKELLEVGSYMMNKPVEKEYKEFKKTKTFKESEFLLIDFLKFLGFNDLQIKIGIMNKTDLNYV